jgi:hypothetical protein
MPPPHSGPVSLANGEPSPSVCEGPAEPKRLINDAHAVTHHHGQKAAERSRGPAVRLRTPAGGAGLRSFSFPGRGLRLCVGLRRSRRARVWKPERAKHVRRRKSGRNRETPE